MATSMGRHREKEVECGVVEHGECEGVVWDGRTEEVRGREDIIPHMNTPVTESTDYDTL